MIRKSTFVLFFYKCDKMYLNNKDNKDNKVNDIKISLLFYYKYRF